MADSKAMHPLAAEITELLDQCSPEELNGILESIEHGSLSVPAPGASAPVPPPGPPPGSLRRPCPTAVKRAEVAPGEAGAPEGPVTMDDVKRLLAEHTAGVVSEVQKLLPSPFSRVEHMVHMPDANTLDMGMLSQVLADRDREVQALEARLAELQVDLSAKDRRVAELSCELDTAVREVRHRQLDLEFQQLKLEERVRSNAELEQAQRNLSARVEEAALSARHAALEAEMGRTTPRGLRAQGTLPWTLRKNRLPAVGLGDGH